MLRPDADTLDKIMAFEADEMTEQETIEFFQELIDSGLVWQLQGAYGRLAMRLIDAGICKGGRPQ